MIMKLEMYARVLETITPNFMIMYKFYDYV